MVTEGVDGSEVFIGMLASPKLRSNKDCEYDVSLTRYSSRPLVCRVNTPCETLKRCVVSSYVIQRVTSQRQPATNKGTISQQNKPHRINVLIFVICDGRPDHTGCSVMVSCSECAFRGRDVSSVCWSWFAGTCGVCGGGGADGGTDGGADGVVSRSPFIREIGCQGPFDEFATNASGEIRPVDASSFKRAEG